MLKTYLCLTSGIVICFTSGAFAAAEVDRPVDHRTTTYQNSRGQLELTREEQEELQRMKRLVELGKKRNERILRERQETEKPKQDKKNAS